MNGLKRYNEIQKALSSFKKESGVRFVAGFQQTAKQIYHDTKEQNIKYVIQNVDQILENLIPELSPEYFEPTPFFLYDINAHGGRGIVAQEAFPDNLQIRSTQLKGKDWTGEYSDVDFNIIFKDFSDYCNENQDVFWDNSDDAPRFYFTKIDFDPIDEVYYTELVIDREDACGFVPGMEIEKQFDVPHAEAHISEEPEEEIPEQARAGKEDKKKASEDAELKRIKAETERLAAETKKEKASAKKLSELNKAVDRLESQLERGLITKSEFKKYLKKLHEA